ncbi:NRDE family protein [Microbacterium sp. SD291]|uniref:NRDE family protein n=1 Tax=Microbacterium sp. SD291 TaxID=2782007 RepID=UPI001A96FE21|nr:NRDE family protein [Microbacterium sp. SD291]MBO0981851.1 NRDE family protein [Microbacterium sp. SD291]
MCTVVIDVADAGDARLLAVRDEDPLREWDELGSWWPERHPGVIGIRDRRAGGAWMAVNAAERRLAVLLNRADVLDLADDQALSRGSLALESVEGRSPDGRLPMHGFNLLEVRPEGARVLSWDGRDLRETPIAPGTHMIAHDDLDDPGTPRIAAWLPEFRALGRAAESADWPGDWIALLAESARLSPEDDRAIIRDNRPHGYPTQSLLYCTASVTADGAEVLGHALPSPGHWSD